jgi:hypothetical protein
MHLSAARQASYRMPHVHVSGKSGASLSQVVSGSRTSRYPVTSDVSIDALDPSCVHGLILPGECQQGRMRHQMRARCKEGRDEGGDEPCLSCCPSVSFSCCPSVSFCCLSVSFLLSLFLALANTDFSS